MNMDKKDLISYFIHLNKIHEFEDDIVNIFENYEISKLDINRIYRYIDKYTNYENNNITSDNEIED